MSKSVFVLGVFFSAAIAWGQFSSGFQGTVVDRSGGIVPGVVIRVTNVETNVRREVVSSESGVYVVPSLTSGTYTIEAWQEKLGTALQSVTLGAKETKAITFSFKPLAASTN